MPGCPPALGALKDKSRVMHLQGGGLPVGMTPAKATGLTGATAHRGRAGRRGGSLSVYITANPLALLAVEARASAGPAGRHDSQAPGEFVQIFTLRKPYFSTKFLYQEKFCEFVYAERNFKIK